MARLAWDCAVSTSVLCKTIDPWPDCGRDCRNACWWKAMADSDACTNLRSGGTPRPRNITRSGRSPGSRVSAHCLPSRPSASDTIGNAAHRLQLRGSFGFAPNSLLASARKQKNHNRAASYMRADASQGLSMDKYLGQQCAALRSLGVAGHSPAMDDDCQAALPIMTVRHRGALVETGDGHAPQAEPAAFCANRTRRTAPARGIST